METGFGCSATNGLPNPDHCQRKQLVLCNKRNAGEFSKRATGGRFLVVNSVPYNICLLSVTVNGIQEVRGSIPRSSTRDFKGLGR